jgi:hypothetical protein
LRYTWRRRLEAASARTRTAAHTSAIASGAVGVMFVPL